MPVRRALPSPVVIPRSSYYGECHLSTPVVIPRSSYYDTSSRHDYGIDESIDRVGYVSNAVLDESYDRARQSKNRDNELIRNTRAAIISTEQHTSPRAAAVARRIRASTAPPAPRPAPVQQAPAAQLSSYTKVEEGQLSARPSPYPRPSVVIVPLSSSALSFNRSTSKPVVLVRGGSVPPPEVSRGTRAASLPPRQRAAPAGPAPVPTSTLWAHRPMPLYKNVARRARAASLEPPVRTASYNYYQRSVEEPVNKRALPTSSLHAHRPMVLKKDLVRLAKARAGEPIGRSVRATSEPRDLTKASDFYFSIPQVKERALQRYLYAERARAGPNAKPKRVSLGNFPQVYVPWTGQGPSNRSKEGIYYRAPISSSGLHSSKPPLPKPTDRKAIRDVDGFTKPRNIMSWQYRVESRLSPDDYIYQPSSYIRLREQVRDAQEKMDRQRQLLDRYLDVDNFSTSSSRNDATNNSSG